MESIINFIFLTIFILLVYNYSLVYFRYHKDVKQVYLPYDLKEGFMIGGQNKKSCKNCVQSNTLKCTELEDTNDNNYDCICKPGFSGKNCDFNDTKSLGVQVILNDKDYESLKIKKRESIYKRDIYKQWNNYI